MKDLKEDILKLFHNYAFKDLIEERDEELIVKFRSKNFFVDEIINKMFPIAERHGYKPAFLIKNVRNSLFEIFIRKVKEAKVNATVGYHYSDSDKIISQGLKAQKLTTVTSLVPSPFDDNTMMQGIYNEPRVYFYLNRDDDDAEMTFGKKMNVFEVDLSGIELFNDEDYLGDEEINAVYAKINIEPQRIKQLKKL